MRAFVRSLSVLWISLQIFSPWVGAILWKSKISLDPPWNRIFGGDNVMLTCNGGKSVVANSTKWYHNDSPLSNSTSSSLKIVNAKIQDSGKYTCQNKENKQSNPVYLQVFSDWLLLQVSDEEVRKGKPLFIRCQTWRNMNAYKMIYFKDGIGLKYWYGKHNISIAKAEFKDHGTYRCEAIVQRIKRSSASLNITVIASKVSFVWLHIFIPLLIWILFTVDIGLFISTHQQLKLFLKLKKKRKGNKRQDAQPKKKDRKTSDPQLRPDPKEE
ncbi:high affinity immunoglobulin epsilon receptor subunit alpha [Echinops telfairi]|uniref:high affinity immunoglobulin epsilon receptor subunit alpha n=1 Tax=Echinops telfairi TaxID=9371 RepID=UPI00122F9D56|nr:high affinity immunoglobulin epsilon receptor subunit alpha [Echinops telfairi]